MKCLRTIVYLEDRLDLYTITFQEPNAGFRIDRYVLGKIFRNESSLGSLSSY